MIINVYLGSNLKYLRKARKLTQTDIGKLVNKGKNAIFYWEDNSRQPTLEDIFTLAQFFNVPVGDFIYKDLSLADNKIVNQKNESVVQDNGLKEENNGNL